jgi:hypothetical protein
MNASRSKQILKSVAVLAVSVWLTACSGSSGSTNTVTPPTPLTQSDFSGQYTYSVTGTNPTDGDFAVSGSLVADGKGNITGGVADYNLGSGIDRNVPLTGTYTVSAGVATIKLTDGAGTQETYSVPVVKTGSTTIAEADGTGSGLIYAAPTTAFTTAGTYTFSLAGDGEGTLTATGGFVAPASGTFSSGTELYTDAGVPHNYTALSGFISTPLSNGRGQIVIGGNSFSYYATSASQISLVGLDDRSLLDGTAQHQ